MAMSFDQWMDQVEIIVYNEIEFYLSDLPDENFRMNYGIGLTCKQMADIVLGNYYDQEEYF